MEAIGKKQNESYMHVMLRLYVDPAIDDKMVEF